MEIQIQVKVEGFYIWLAPEEIGRPSEAVREFEEFLRTAARQGSTFMTLPGSQPRLAAPEPPEGGHRRQPLVRCPHCQAETLKGAGLAAHIKREHSWLMAQRGGS